MLEAPIPLPGVQSPQNPFLPNPDAWTIRASRGFEGMARSIDGKTLYPMLEGALRNDPDPRRRILNEFDLRSGSYTGRTWQYRVDAAFPDAVIGDLTAVDQHRFVLIERDDAQGADARQKKVYLIDLRRLDADGFLAKRLVSTCSASVIPTASRCRRGRASSASATRSRSRCSRWRASRSSTASACSSPTTTTIRSVTGVGSPEIGPTTPS